MLFPSCCLSLPVPDRAPPRLLRTRLSPSRVLHPAGGCPPLPGSHRATERGSHRATECPERECHSHRCCRVTGCGDGFCTDGALWRALPLRPAE